MANASNTRFSSVTIDAASRTPITAPADCRAIVLRNSDMVNDCTIYDADSGGTGIVLQGGAERRFGVESRTGRYFASGDVVVWATAAAGTGPITTEALL